MIDEKLGEGTFAGLFVLVRGPEPREWILGNDPVREGSLARSTTLSLPVTNRMPETCVNLVVTGIFFGRLDDASGNCRLSQAPDS